jgi:DNA-binding CsgD family transcriptional regulator
MDLIKFDTMKKTWYQIAKYHTGDIAPNFELEIHKKLLNIFHVGDFYYYIINIPTIEMEHVSESITKVLGLENPDEFSAKYIFENLHPEDRNRFFAHEQKVTEFFNNLAPEQVLKYKVNYDYRIKHADKSYRWIHHQVVTLQSDEQGSVIRTLGIHTDITHMKSDNKPCGLSFIGMEGEPSYYNVDVEEIILLPSKELFSMREKQVLRLIIEGHNSRVIADMLHLSIHTINSHRKNILSKSGCKTLVELGGKAIREGWI